MKLPNRCLLHLSQQRPAIHAIPQLTRYEFLTGTVFNKRRSTDTAIRTSTLHMRRPKFYIAPINMYRLHVLPLVLRIYRRLRPG